MLHKLQNLWPLLFCLYGSQLIQTQAAQPSAYFVATVEASTGNQVSLTTNVSTWNISHVFGLVYDVYPLWFFGFNASVISTYFDSTQLALFPTGALRYYKLCDVLPSDDVYCAYLTSLNGTYPSGYACVGPLTKTSHKNSISDQGGTLSECGLSCEAAVYIYDLSDAEQQAIDIVKYVACAVTLSILGYLIYNLMKRQMKSHIKFFQKSFLYQCPYYVTFSLSTEVTLLATADIVGKENIMCNADDNSYSSLNPEYGENVLCTLWSLVFHASMMSFLAYTVLLAICIFATLHDPLKHMWGIPRWIWHTGVITFVVGMEIGSLLSNASSGSHPMGICVPGSSSKPHLLVFWTIPSAVGEVLTLGFMLASAVLLCKQNSMNNKMKVSNKGRSDMHSFMTRMFMYACFIFCSLSFLFLTAFVFYMAADRVGDGMIDVVECQTINYYANFFFDYSLTCEHPYNFNPFWFHSWSIISFLAAGGTLILVRSSKRKQQRTNFTSVGSKIVSNIRNTVSNPNSIANSDANSPVPESDMKSDIPLIQTKTITMKRSNEQ